MWDTVKPGLTDIETGVGGVSNNVDAWGESLLGAGQTGFTNMNEALAKLGLQNQGGFAGLNTNYDNLNLGLFGENGLGSRFNNFDTRMSDQLSGIGRNLYGPNGLGDRFDLFNSGFFGEGGLDERFTNFSTEWDDRFSGIESDILNIPELFPQAPESDIQPFLDFLVNDMEQPEPAAFDFGTGLKKLEFDGDGGTGTTDAPDAIPDEFFDAPQLELPEIIDYTDAIRDPYLDSVVNSVGDANPFDTRRDDILGGQISRVTEKYDRMKENIKHRYAVNNNLGSPAYRAEMREADDMQMRAELDIESQFGMAAGGTDESIRRGRTADLSQALAGEFGRTQQQMGFQDQLQRNSNQDFMDLLSSYQQAYAQPQQQMDEGLRYMLGGIGSTMNAGSGIESAMKGFSGAAANYNTQANTSANSFNTGLSQVLQDFGWGRS